MYYRFQLQIILSFLFLVICNQAQLGSVCNSSWLLVISSCGSKAWAEGRSDVSLSIQEYELEAERFYETGQTYDAQGEYPSALEFYQKALQIYQNINNVFGEAECLHRIGKLHQRQGRFNQALEIYHRALSITNETDNQYLEWRILNNVGSSYLGLGQYTKALIAYKQALVVVQLLNYPQGEQAVLSNIGLVYGDLGQHNRALELYQQALVINRRIEAVSAEDELFLLRSEGSTLHHIGLIYEQLRQHLQAIEMFQQALAIKRQIGDPYIEVATLIGLGSNYNLLGQPELGLPFLEQAIEISHNVGNKNNEAYALDSLGKLYSNLEQFSQAWQAYYRALIILLETEDRPAQLFTLSNIADLLIQQNQPELAIIFYKRSVNVTESIRRDIQGLPIEQQQSYTNTVADTYRKLADLLLQQDRVLEAQQVLDLLKVQEIQDYLRRGVRGTEQTAEGIYLLEAEKQVFARFDNLLQQGSRLAELEAIPPEDLTPEQREEYLQLEQTRRQIKATFTEFLELPDVKAALEQLRVNAPQALELDALDALRQNLAQLPQGAILLYPFVLDDRLELVVLSPNLPPIHKTVLVTRVELNHAISEFLTVLQNPESDPKPAAEKLYNWLIRPIEPFLTESDANVILYAPDRQLRYIPLAALHDGEQWFVEKFQINQLTAVGLTSLNTPPRAQPRILAGAFSEGRYNISRRNGEYRYPFSGLPFAKAEVQTIASLFPDTRQLINQAFTEDATLPFLNSYNIIHFATHAMFTTGAPEDSFILLGNGETIDMHDIRNLSLTNVDLMVLSGCQTAVSTLNLGQSLGDGVEILGFGYQVQNAGVRAAIASLWSVDDGGTEVLMSQFYALLQQSSLSKSAALQQAQIALITGEQHFQLRDELIRQRNLGDIPQLDTQQLTHPYYWAPFILIGNGL